MKLKNQVCTLEQAKILKDEFGLELDTYFAWYYPIHEEDKKWRIGHLIDARYYLKQSLVAEYYPALNCAELGVLLPAYIDYEDKEFILTSEQDDNDERVNTLVFYFCDNPFNPQRRFKQYKHHEAHAKADLLIHLLGEKIIKPEDLKL